MKVKIEEQLKKQLPPPKERGDQIKRRAIQSGVAFLGVMLSLTLLSRTADSLIIPQVVASGVKSGRIDHGIEVKGQIEAKDDSTMAVGSGLIVSKVHVEEGDKVKTGDILLELDAKEVEERLQNAKRELEKLILQKQQLELEEDLRLKEDPVTVAEDQLMRLQEDKNRTISSENLKIQRIGKELEDKIQALEEAKQALEETKQKAEATHIEDLEKQREEAIKEVEQAKIKLADDTYERDKAIERAEMAVKNARENIWLLGGGEATSALQALDRAEMELKQTRSDWERRIEKAKVTLKVAEEKLKNIEDNEVDDRLIEQAEEKVELVQKEITQTERVLADAKVDQEIAIINLDRQIEDAKKDIEKARKEQDNAIRVEEQADEKQAIRVQLLVLDIEAKQEEINKLEGVVAEGGELKAYADGIVTEVKVEEGTKTSEGPLLTFVASENDYIFEAEITEEDNKHIQVGDQVTITFEGKEKHTINAVIDQIGAILEGESDQFKVSVNLEEGYPGQKAVMKTKSTSEQYHTILPIEALRKDNQEEYILVVREKETTLGKQMLVEKVPVVVSDRNKKQVAIQGAVNSQDQVIISSNKPIQAGDRVRLGEE